MKYIDLIRSSRRRYEFGRFLVAGGANTLITYVIYLLALLTVSYRIAYTISYAAGILISYCLTSRFVFQRKLALRAALQYPVVYIAQYALGLALLTILVDKLRMDRRLAPAVIVICTIPVTFLLSRLVIRRAPERQ